MMRIIEARLITETVKNLCIKANYVLPDDVRDALHAARRKEYDSGAQDTLDKIILNADIAQKEGLPICQDTGIACIFVEMGAEVHINGNINDAVNEGVREGYRTGYLRNSLVRDPFDRVNTGDNTPAFIYLEIVPGDALTITAAPKGFGSENMSRLKMLAPSDGEEGVIDFVTGVVRAAGANPCPPVTVGIGIGGSFDKAALLAKKALLRPLKKPHKSPFYAALEETLLNRINALGIGPQGFGGGTTALGVAIEVMPVHIAGLPCAVNMNCHAARHATETL